MNAAVPPESSLVFKQARQLYEVDEKIIGNEMSILANTITLL